MTLGIILVSAVLSSITLPFSLENGPSCGLFSIIRNFKSHPTSGPRNRIWIQSWWRVTVVNPTLQNLVWCIENLRDWSLFLVHLWFGELRFSCSLVFKNGTYPGIKPLKVQVALWLKFFWFYFLNFPKMILWFPASNFLQHSHKWGTRMVEGNYPMRGVLKLYLH